MAISMEMIKELRQRTGAGVLECKEALAESGDDMDGAAEYLRKKGATKAAKKADRNTKEGAVSAALEGNLAAMVEVKCETDFVSRNETFQALVSELAAHVMSSPEAADDESFLAQPLASDKSRTVRDLLSSKVLEIGENIVVGRRAKIALSGPGTITRYIHGVGNIGVLLELGADSDKTAGAPEFSALGKDLAMQIAAMNPIAVSPDQIPQAVVDKEREIFAAQAREAGKPENIIPKIVEGNIKKYFSEVCLPMQAFVKENKKTVETVVKETAAKLGGKVEIRRFIRFQLGE